MATPGPAAQDADTAARLILRPPPQPGPPRPLVIVGGGEHARVVADAVRTRHDVWRLVGFTDPRPSPDAADRLDLEHLGDDTALGGGGSLPEGTWLVLGIGALAARRAVTRRLNAASRWATVVHAAAWISPSASLEPGAIVLAGAVVNAGAVIGRHGIVNSGAIVEHDVHVGAFSHLAPGATVGGGARIGGDAFVGLGARIRDHVAVGDGAVVGMGAVVTDDVPAGVTVTGAPARVATGERRRPVSGGDR